MAGKGLLIDLLAPPYYTDTSKASLAYTVNEAEPFVTSVLSCTAVPCIEQVPFANV